MREKGSAVPRKAVPRLEEDLMSRVGLASLRLELGLVPLRAKEEARRYLKTQGKHFDGAQLVKLCLEGRASDGTAALQKGFTKLRAALFLEESGAPPRPAVKSKRGGSIWTKLSASVLARLIVFGITCFLVVLFLVLARYNFAWFNIYDWSDSIRDFFKS